MRLDIDRSTTDSGVVVLALSGTMTMGNMLQKFERSVEELTNQQQNRIVLDMSQITYIDSSAIGVLLACASKAKVGGGQLRLAGVSERVATILGLTGTDEILVIDPTRDDAVSALSPKA